jgi:iron complex transport system ATP-binding protein
MLNTDQLSYLSIIKEITLSFSPGRLYAILGPNGAGKTTLLKLLCGLHKPSKGHVYWQGEDLALFDRSTISRTITLVPQNPHTVFDYRVEEFVAMGRYAHPHCKNSITKALEAVDGLKFAGRLLHQLSQGERQRIYIARALATEAPVILFDEPAAHLDIKQQLCFWELMRELSYQGKTLLVANHDLIRSERFCDEALLLHHGQCVAIGKTDEVLNSQQLQLVFGIDTLECGVAAFQR